MRRAPLSTLEPPPTLAIAGDVLALRPRAIWRTVTRQPLSVLALYVYIFFEYVRPQAIYTALDVLPFALMSLTAAFCTALLELSRRRWCFLDSAMALFTMVVLASSIVAYDRSVSMNNMSLYVSWLFVYFALSTSANTLTKQFLLIAGWLLWNYKMAFFAFRSWAGNGFAFRGWGVSGAPGWFSNSGEFGIEMCIVFPVSLYFALALRRHVSRPVYVGLLSLPFFAVTGAVASSSRGALVGMAAVALWMLLRSRYKVRGTIGLAIFALATYAIVPDEQRARLSESGEDNTSVSRLTYWTRGIELAERYPFLGVGYKNWTTYNQATYRVETGLEGIGLPHNIFVEAAAELGYIGFASLLALLGGSFWLNYRTRRLARRLGPSGAFATNLALGLDGGTVGYMASAFFVTVLFYPYQWVHFGMSAGLHLAVRRAERAARRAQSAAGAPVGDPRELRLSHSGVHR